MSIDWSTGVPFLSPEEPEDGRRKQKRPIVLVGGAMNGLGGMMGPLYPVLLDPADNEEEKDPNP